MSDAPENHHIFTPLPGQIFRDATAAIIVLDDGRYLMQLRDDKPGIFYPDHWGFFGGAIESGETAEEGLMRELEEEIGYRPPDCNYFTRMDFFTADIGGRDVKRLYYTVPLPVSILPDLTLGEGRRMEPLTAAEIVLEKRVAPYDSFVVWMHQTMNKPL